MNNPQLGAPPGVSQMRGKSAGDAGVILTLDGQHLEAATPIWFRKSERAKPLVLNDVFQIPLALLVTTRDLLSGVSESLVPDTITRAGIWRGWIQSDGGRSARELEEILDFRPGTRIAAVYTTPSYTFADFRLKEVNIEFFDYLVECDYLIWPHLKHPIWPRLVTSVGGVRD